ncbi:FliH/SctL family protein [Nocardioides sp. LHG3406-4]|uniref:FliH/SctL family protein n=1 Tax=Nocardioides sp. LHG3406-4 TaxID=2804575 RepID=UPI003CE9DA4C
MSEALAADFRPTTTGIPQDADISTIATVATLPELRKGHWTRYGNSGVLADEVTEHALAALAETTRAAARSQGYAIGWTEGRRDAEASAYVAARRHQEEADLDRQRHEAEHRAALDVLKRTTAQLVTAIDECRRDVDERATDLAFELTRTIVGAAQERETDGDVVRRVLAATPQQTGVTVRVNPRTGAQADLSGLTSQGITVVVDPTLDQGDVLIETDARVVDLRVSTAMARVGEALR